jgi:hypothetical protein
VTNRRNFLPKAAKIPTNKIASHRGTEHAECAHDSLDVLRAGGMKYFRRGNE